jgi:hypothetical protein
MYSTRLVHINMSKERAKRVTVRYNPRCVGYKFVEATDERGVAAASTTRNKMDTEVWNDHVSILDESEKIEKKRGVLQDGRYSCRYHGAKEINKPSHTTDPRKETRGMHL